MAGQQLNAVLHHIRQRAPAQAPCDRELLDRFLAGHDEAAFRTLVERHGAMVLGICRRVLRNAHDAEDATQATFLVLARKAASVRNRESVASFLHGVAFHVATNLKRDLARQSAREAFSVREATQADTANDASWREVQAVLDEELARLPEHYRCPLILCYLEGKTRDEAAGQLGWGLATLRGRLERGRERLRARLTRRGLTLSAALLATALTESSTPAALPPTLLRLTVKAGLLQAGGEGASARVSALAEGAIRALFAARMKAALVVLGLVLAASIGLGLGAWDRPRADQTHASNNNLHNPARPGGADEPNVAAGGLFPLLDHGHEPVEGARDTQEQLDDAVLPPPPERARTQDERVPLRFLDLQPYANQKLKESFGGRSKNHLAGLPPGEQVLVGTRFNIGEGLIQLRGRGTHNIEKVEGIKVGARFSRLSILHATQWGAPSCPNPEKKEAIVGHYMVHYADRHHETIPIVYGKDVRDWWYKDCMGPSRATVAWKGTNEDARASGATLRLYLTCWKNPEPAREVACIDFISTCPDVGPFCVAMTIEE
jgi:RNA polymerase sigma factor (sigma-70 family)